jgi:hypothetical protein
MFPGGMKTLTAQAGKDCAEMYGIADVSAMMIDKPKFMGIILDQKQMAESSGEGSFRRAIRGDLLYWRPEALFCEVLGSAEIRRSHFKRRNTIYEDAAGSGTGPRCGVHQLSNHLYSAVRLAFRLRKIKTERK